MIRAIIQARMNSTRLPGKVMKKIGSKIVIDHVIGRVNAAGLKGKTVVAMPASEENDELAKHINGRVHVVRGPEDNVALRFSMALKQHPCDAFVRICADSPFIDPELITSIAAMMHKHDADIVSTVGQGFPPGQQVECINTKLFLTKLRCFDDYEKEHVTPWFYRNKVRTRYHRQWPQIYAPSMVLDTREDLKRLRAMA